MWSADILCVSSQNKTCQHELSALRTADFQFKTCFYVFDWSVKHYHVFQHIGTLFNLINVGHASALSGQKQGGGGTLGREEEC